MSDDDSPSENEEEYYRFGAHRRHRSNERWRLPAAIQQEAVFELPVSAVDHPIPILVSLALLASLGMRINTDDMTVDFKKLQIYDVPCKSYISASFILWLRKEI